MFLLTFILLGLIPLAPAEASTNFGVVPGFPTILKVGQPPVNATVRVVNAWSDKGVTVTDLLLTPSCSNWHISCAGGIADPGALTFSATGTGVAPTGCANQTFNITVANSANGQLRFRPATSASYQLSRHDIGTDLDICEIVFTVKANRAPIFDSHPVEGVQANQNMAVYGVLDDGTPEYSENNDITTFEMPPPPAEPPIADFNGDGRSDISFYRKSAGHWWIKDAPAVVDWGGGASDVAVPADYDNDGKSNIAVYRKATGIWYIQGMPAVNWGSDLTDVPVPGDYDGNGTANLAVYRVATGVWWIQGMNPVSFGGDLTDVPVPADYDGDGDTDLAVYRASTGMWYFQNAPTVNWGGVPGDIPVPADYDNDGKDEIAVYRPATGIWYIQGMPAVNWGGFPTDVPTPGDYDGNGSADIAVYRVATGMWYIQGMPVINYGWLISDRPLGTPPFIK